jgi:hypothetical protein
MHTLRKLKSYVQYQTDIAYLGPRKIFENRYQIQQLIVMGIRKPAAYRYSMLRVEYVRCWRIVNDDGLS